MKKIIKAGLLFGLMFLMAGSAWALPIDSGDLVIMGVGGKSTYNMTHADSNDAWVYYSSFCLEHTNYFSEGSTYKVESVADYTTGGGIDTKGPYNYDPNWVYNDSKDYLSDQTKWLFASYFSGNFGAFSDTLALSVQNAIWYMEDEISDSSSWDSINSAYGGSGYAVTGWDIQAVNLVNLDGSGDIQSQLVGNNPVPEPATMVLFGIGLLSMAGAGRKKIKK